MAPQSRYQGPLVIPAEFEVRPDALDQFLELAKADASQSVAKEQGAISSPSPAPRSRPTW